MFLFSTNFILKDTFKSFHSKILSKLQLSIWISPHKSQIREPKAQNQAFWYINNERLLAFPELIINLIKRKHMMSMEARYAIEMRMLCEPCCVLGPKNYRVVPDLLLQVIEHRFAFVVFVFVQKLFGIHFFDCLFNVFNCLIVFSIFNNKLFTPLIHESSSIVFIQHSLAHKIIHISVKVNSLFKLFLFLFQFEFSEMFYE